MDLGEPDLLLTSLSIIVPITTHEMLKFLTYTLAIDDVLGLASAATAPENYVPPLLNAFKAGLVSEPTVTLWLNKSSTPAVEDHLAPGFGMLTIGGSDKTRCGPLGPFISMYQPEAQGVRVELKSISMGKTTTAPGRPGNNLPWVLR